MTAVVYSCYGRGSNAARAADELGRRVRVHALMDVVEDTGERVDVDAADRFERATGEFTGVRGRLRILPMTEQPIERAQQEIFTGNLYLNRGCTGAIVERHPFGGFKMSGGGTKAGGKAYLENFLFPRLIAENVMRRGFTPSAK